MSNPFTLGECGHTFCRDCVCAVLREQCICPTCHMPVYVRNLKRSPQYSSIVADIGKLGDAIRQCNADHAKENDGGGVDSVVERRSKKSAAREAAPSVGTAKVTNSGKKQRLASPRPSPAATPHHADMRIACTSLSVDQKKILHSFAIYAGKVELVDAVTAGATHLITCTSKSSVEKDALLAPRTMKYMLAILRGIPVLSFDWVLESIAASCWLEHDGFMVRGDEVCKQATDACRRSMAAKQQRLFSGQRFFLSPSLSSASSSSSAASNSAGVPSRSELARLIEAGDGQVCTTKGPDTWIIAPATATKRRSSAATQSAGMTLTVAELLDHVSRYERIAIGGTSS